jgi:hypothetical protein
MTAIASAFALARISRPHWRHSARRIRGRDGGSGASASAQTRAPSPARRVAALNEKELLERDGISADRDHEA